MSKAFKGKTCVYCAVGDISATADHVVARNFFPLDQRHGIPKVPACHTCNNAKSELETYLTTVLPFGGTHTQSSRILNELVPKRLKRNQKVRHELNDSLKFRSSISPEGHVQSRLTFNIDAEKLEQLYELIVRGLCWWEWQLLLPKLLSDVEVGFLNAEGAAIAEKLLGMQVKRRCRRVIANGLFLYEGVQALDNDLITVWKMSLYGVKFMDVDQTSQTTFICYASTAPKGKALPIRDI